MPEVQMFYAPTFMDESMTAPDKRGNQRPTGKLSGFVFARKFTRHKTGRIKAERMLLPFSWKEDTQEAKVAALSRVIDGMTEMEELDGNPPLTWIPDVVKGNKQ